ncbi:MAG TPA: SpoIIE family protein phosphatase [Thermoanaerobaculia bacterium]
MKRRLAVTLLSLTLFALASWATVERIRVQHRAGWTGLMFYSAQLPKDVAPQFSFMLPPPGSVTSVLSDTPAAEAGVAVRDRVVTINGIENNDMAKLHAWARTVRRGDVVAYRIERDGKIRDVRLRTVSPLTLMPIVIGTVLTFVVALTYLAISILVLWTRPRQRAAWVFFWLSTVGALSFALSALLDYEVTAHAGLEPTMSRVETILVYFGIGFVSMVLTSLLFHLALVFPKELPVVERHPMLIRWLYCGAFLPMLLPFFLFLVAGLTKRGELPGLIVLAIIAVVLFVLWFRNRAKVGTRNAILDHPWRTLAPIVVTFCAAISLAHVLAGRSAMIIISMIIGGGVVLIMIGMAAVYSVATLYALYRGYVTSSVEQKRQVRWPLWGTGVAIGISVTITAGFIIIAMAGKVPPPLLVTFLSAAARLCFILIPLSFAFAILKYRLMDIDIIIRKTVVYSFVTGIIVGAFFALVAGLGTLLTSWLNFRSQTITVVSTLLLAGVFIPVRNRVQRFVDRRFFRRRFDLSEAQQLIQDEVLAATDLQALLRRVVEWIQHALQVRSVVILVPRPGDADVLEAVAAIGVPDGIVNQLTIDRDALGRTESVVPIGTLRLQQDEWARMRRIYAELAVPMHLRGRLEGLLLVGSRLSGTFEDEDREFLASASQQLALGVENLSVSDEARDFEQALQVQRALLPKSMPRVEGVDVDAMWKPARIVGGDYFDVFLLGPTTLAICIADVAGKGMPAALLMANLQAAVKASAARDVSPSDVCAKVSSIVTGTLQGGRFVTFFFALLDTRDLRLRYTNAGHNPPLLLRTDGDVVRLAEGGPVFARLTRAEAFVTTEVSLVAGDTLVLFTDGVTEARNRDEEEYGETRLIDVVRGARGGAAVVVRDIVESVRVFSGGIAHDDVTIVAVKV